MDIMTDKTGTKFYIRVYNATDDCFYIEEISKEQAGVLKTKWADRIKALWADHLDALQMTAA